MPVTISPRTLPSGRRKAYWVARPSRQAGLPLLYRRGDGVIFRGEPPVGEGSTESTYTAATFLPHAPLKVFLDYTNRCNLSCRHCITSSSPTVDTSTELPTARICELVSELADLGVLEIAVGGGEPLIHPHWPTILDHITSTGLNLVITTNGLLATPAAVVDLVKIAPLEIRVSFDGGQVMHEHVRGLNTYRRALGGLTRLTAAGLPTVARLTLCRNGEAELPTLFADVAQTGCTSIKVAVVKPAGRAATDRGAHLVGELPDAAQGERLQELGRPYGLTVRLSTDDFLVTVVDGHDSNLRDAARTHCGAGFDTCHITPRGEVLGCVTIPNLGFGQLATRSFSDVWEDRLAVHYRRQAEGTNTRRLCDSLSSTPGPVSLRLAPPAARPVDPDLTR